MARVIGLMLATAIAFPSAAAGSELIARNAKNVRLQVSKNGKSALLSYRANGRKWYVLAGGAINAKAPTPNGRQVSFRLRRSNTRPGFRGGCRRARPLLPKLVAACTAGGSNWAAQEWRPGLPNFGLPGTGVRSQPRLHLSHWSGPVADLTLKADWSFGGRFRHVYGKLTYRGRPVYGFGTTRLGVPTDPFGRLVYLDTLKSSYGPGWRRENSFVTRNPTGFFCYDFTPTRNGLSGQGAEYRTTVIGPGVTPDVAATVPDPGPYDPERDAAANAEQAQMAPGDKQCRPS